MAAKETFQEQVHSDLNDIGLFLLIIMVTLFVSCHHLSGINKSLKVIAQQKAEQSLELDQKKAGTNSGVNP